jgi:hypothetical protein
MHPSHSSFEDIERDIALHQLRVQPMRFKFAPAPGPGKKTALVLQLLNVNDIRTLEVCFGKDHSYTFTSGIGTINRPPQSRMQDICVIISSLKFHGRIKRKSGLVSHIFSGL